MCVCVGGAFVCMMGVWGWCEFVLWDCEYICYQAVNNCISDEVFDINNHAPI